MIHENEQGKRRGQRGGRKHRPRQHVHHSPHAHQAPKPATAALTVGGLTKSGLRALPYMQHDSDALLHGEPQTLTEAESTLRHVKIAMVDIQAQLGDRARRAAMKPERYDDWRGRTLRMLSLMFARQETLKPLVRELRREELETRADLLCRIVVMACSWVNDFDLSKDLSKEEWELLRRGQATIPSEQRVEIPEMPQS